ncbi:GtrA-like protein [Desulfosporosinus acididurans]|uniref:GtrA-like protein n=1 Tax=Desulfosporosinus acididurans TaxID=476652 RepID=A0A0J1IKM1_9FIRM|nr:GtrA family protein [Desulfosporosinus acididurans]KLU65266.1 GtrA-like protein [Desulfosporosinus acididurans]
MARIAKRHLEFLRFCVVGGLNTGIDFTLFAVLFAWGVPLLSAHTLSYCCGVLNSFWLNRKWTFKDQASPSSFAHKSVRQMVQFICLNFISLAITYVLLLWIHDSWGYPMLLSRLVAIVASLAINFIGSRLWVFRQPRLGSELI